MLYLPKKSWLSRILSFIEKQIDKNFWENKFQKFFKFSKIYIINLYDVFHEIWTDLIKNTPVKTIKRTQSVKKIINFNVKSKKSPAAGGGGPHREPL